MTGSTEPQTKPATQLTKSPWNEYRLLFYSALIGVAGGLGAQLFVWILNFTEHLLLVGIAGCPETRTGKPESPAHCRQLGCVADPAGNHLGRTSLRNIGLYFCPGGGRSRYRRCGGSISLQRRQSQTDCSADKSLRFRHHNRIRRSGRTSEGPTAQISVGVGSMLADLLRLSDEERRVLVLAGMAAGLTAIFRSPLGMAIFSGGNSLFGHGL